MTNFFNGNNQNQEFNSANLLFFLYRWRMPLIIITSIGILASILFSSPYFIKPKYKSTVIMFPVATNSVSKVLLAQNSPVKEDIMGIGEEEQAEQLIQILHSNMIRDRIISKYNLMEHYDISTDSRYKFTRLYGEYENNVKFRRTEFMAVKVTVFDTDPKMAADIANDIAALVDSTKNFMQRERSMKAFLIVDQEHKSLKQEVDEIVDSLAALGKKGVNDYERQSEVMNQQFAIALASGNTSAQKALQVKLDTLGKYGGAFLSLKNSLEFKTEQLTLLKTKYQEAKVDAEQSLPQKFIVNAAYPAERKSYPIRWIIVTVTTFSVFFLSVLIILLLEQMPSLVPAELKKKKVVSFKPDVKFRLPKIKLSEYKMENYFNNTNLINLLIKWRLHLIIIVVAAAVLAVIFSSPLFITPKFKSYAVVYPSNVSPYSEESEAEQMYQILQSQDIKDSVMVKFDLAKHYEIEQSYKYYRTALNYEYSQSVNVNKTPYDAVSIEVLDKDPQMACDMVNAILYYYNRKVSEMHKEKYSEVIDMYVELLHKKQASIDSLKLRLYDLSVEKGLLAYEQTSEQIMIGYLKTVMGGSGSVNTPEVNRLKANMEKHGGELILLVESIKQEARTYADFKVEYEDALRFFTAKLTYTNLITRPFPADKKSYPIRWLIVSITVIMTLFFAIVVMMLLENLRVRKIRKTAQQK